MKKVIFKILTSFLVVVGILVAYFISIYEKGNYEQPVMQEATLPIINMVYQGTDINMLQGYTSYMEAQYIHDAITPLESDRSIGVTIKKYDNVIATMSYEIRTLDTERLIDKQNIEKFLVSEDSIFATIDASRILESDTEYMLIIKLVSEKHGDIYYYTRIEEQSQSDVKAHIDFVSNMSLSSLDDDTAMKYLPYLEPSSSSDNDNLADVSIKSSFSNFTWGDLKVSRVTHPVVTIKEIIDDLGCYELQYKVTAENAYGNAQYYNIKEFYRVKKRGEQMFLYVYERKMEQIFDGSNQNVSHTRINLGLDSDLNIEYAYSPTGSFISFVKERNLWLMDMKNNKITNIFSFESGSDHDVRDVFDENDIEIVSTDGKGDVLFIVYGYMNRGGHEGKVGTGLYRYVREDNTVKELVFVPTTKPYYIMRDSIGNFAYIKDDSLLYMMIGDSIYTITFDSNEYVRLVSGLKKGNYIISEDENIIAWHQNTEESGADSIRVINIQTGDDYIIDAEEGDFIKVLGFIEHDLIYGTGKQIDIHKNEAGENILPLYKINVVLESKENIESYQKENIYISDVTISGNMIKLERLAKDENGAFVNITSDQFINKNVVAKEKIVLSTIATELKKKELILEFAYTVTSDNDLTLSYPQEISFMSGNSFEPVKEQTVDNNYYVYGEGSLQLVTNKIWEAMNVAYDNYGVVLSGSGDYIWARSSKVNNVGIDMKYMVGQGYNDFESSKTLWQGSVLDVSRAYYDTLFYYVTKRMPVLTYVDNYGFVCIDGYNGYSGNVNIVYMTDLDTGVEFELGYYELENMYKKHGMHYMVLVE